MGGSINIAIRTKDGNAVSHKRWTNEYPFYFLHPEFFTSDEIAKNYIEDASSDDYFEQVDSVSPCEYGMILIDYVSNTIIDSNNYSSINGFPTFMAKLKYDQEYIRFFNEKKLSIKEIQINTESGEVTRSAFDIDYTRTAEDILAEELVLDKVHEDSDDDIVIRRDFIIDMSPMTYHHVPYDDTAHVSIERIMKEINFPLPFIIVD